MTVHTYVHSICKRARLILKKRAEYIWKRVLQICQTAPYICNKSPTQGSHCSRFRGHARTHTHPFSHTQTHSHAGSTSWCSGGPLLLIYHCNTLQHTLQHTYMHTHTLTQDSHRGILRVHCRSSVCAACAGVRLRCVFNICTSIVPLVCCSVL